MSNHRAGHAAETRAARYLQELGYQILVQNWKTRYCEIDLVAQKGRTIYFVEVKYRRSSMQGTGLDYITPRKLKQMHFAAEVWVQAHGWEDDYQLAAVSIDGSQITFLDLVQ